MSHKSEETLRHANERREKMRAKGYILVEEAAELVSHPRSNIYHWIRTGEVRRKTWGAGHMSQFVCLADLKKKIPAAFEAEDEAVADAAPNPVKPKRTHRKSQKAS